MIQKVVYFWSKVRWRSSCEQNINDAINQSGLAGKVETISMLQWRENKAAPGNPDWLAVAKRGKLASSLSFCAIKRCVMFF